MTRHVVQWEAKVGGPSRTQSAEPASIGRSRSVPHLRRSDAVAVCRTCVDRTQSAAPASNGR
eukprot:6520323-Heterocapsa_arctica.AAC.1